MSIVSFGRRERFRFEALGSLNQWAPRMVPGVYAITYKQSPEGRPKAHTVVYFGQADDMSQQVDSINKDVGVWWSERGGAASDLFVFIYAMPGSTRWQRASVQNQLVSEYSPHLNDD
jgi:hypothetical protein